MELSKNKPLIFLGALILVLLVILFIVKVSVGSSNNNSNNNNNNNNNQEKNINYPKVNDTAEQILSKVYSPNRDYYSGFDSDSYEKENIFGNKKQKSVSSFSQKTKMTIALNTFRISDMTKISCSNIGWNKNWNNSVCGSNLGNIAYTISVQELNNRVEDIFNTKLDYSKLDITDLTIGLCSGENRDSYVFRYIKEQSIYVSTKKGNNCIINGKIEVTAVEKKQFKDLLTLDVFYKKTPTVYLDRKPYYGESTNYEDQFFFKVKKDGSYYFIASTLIQK